MNFRARLLRQVSTRGDTDLSIICPIPIPTPTPIAARPEYPGPRPDAAGPTACDSGRMTTPALSDSELAYLRTQRLGRLATVDAQGRPQANPVGFFLRDDGTVDIGGRAMGGTKKWRNVAANRFVSLVVDDVASLDPWTVRGVEIRGEAEQVVGPHDLGAHLSEELIRIRPYRILSWGLDPAAPVG